MSDRAAPTIPLVLPDGCAVRGRLYAGPAVRYESGDVLEVDLPSGLTIDLGWDDGGPGGPFAVSVYREYFGDRAVCYRRSSPAAAASAVERLARALS